MPSWVMTDVPVLVAGGGIAGLSAALAMARQGTDVLVLEREAGFSEAGAGLQLGPNAVAALKATGAWSAVEPVTSRPQEIHMRDGRSGRLIKRLGLTPDFERRYGSPYRVAHRADLHLALLAQCRQHPRIELRTGKGVSEVAQSPAGVLVNGTLKGMCMVAADGVHSATRQILLPGSNALASGYSFHRALFALPAARDVALDCVNLWLLPQAHIVHYPVGPEQKLNLVCVTEGTEAVQALLHRCCPSLAMVLQGAAFTEWPGLMAPALPHWQFGRVTLVGDAAHGTLPFLAQGAAMALEDAASLRVLDGVWSVPPERMKRTARLHRRTLAMGRTYHFDGAMAFLRDGILGSMPQSLLLRQLDWLYRWHAATMVRP